MRTISILVLVGGGGLLSEGLVSWVAFVGVAFVGGASVIHPLCPTKELTFILTNAIIHIYYNYFLVIF